MFSSSRRVAVRRSRSVGQITIQLINAYLLVDPAQHSPRHGADHDRHEMNCQSRAQLERRVQVVQGNREHRHVGVGGHIEE